MEDYARQPRQSDDLIERGMDKKQVAHLLEETGTLLEIKGENPFKCRAYYNAARTIEGLEEDLEEAARQGVVVELNANPHRLDLDWRLLRKATSLGIKIAINPDAHSPEGLKDMRYGVGVARKGRLTAEDVLNTLPLEEIRRSVGAS